MENAYPGQFVMLYLPAEYGHHLPRPFSIFGLNSKREELILLLQVKGLGTGLLEKSQPGAEFKLLGPLGSGFPALKPGSLLVAGGMGIAPLAFLAASGAEPRTLIYGARTADQLICPAADLKLPGLTVIEATEDGSRGEKGNAVELMAPLLPRSEAVFACGPELMLAAVAKACLAAGVDAWVSVEEQMACGIGACLCCAQKTADGYKRVCHDGPVFPAGGVSFDGGC